jgi:hypothetical protein
VVDNEYFRQGVAREKDLGGVRKNKTGELPPPPYILASARFVPRKNIDGLIRGYWRYCEMVSSPWNLVIVGDGPLREMLEKYAASKANGRVVFLGFKQYQELPKCYAGAGVFVHAAHREAWGLVVNEAIACSLPVLVASRVGCASDLVIDGLNGFWFDSGNKEELARQLASVTMNQTMRHEMGIRSAELSRGFEIGRFGLSLRAAVAGQPGNPREKQLPWKRSLLRDAFGREWFGPTRFAVRGMRMLKYKVLYARAQYWVHQARALANTAEEKEFAVCFLLGAGRSGTTVLASSIGLHPRVKQLIEPHYMWAALRSDMDITNLYARVRAKYILRDGDCTSNERSILPHLLVLASGGCSRSELLLEKTPHNAARIGYLRTALAGARFIHIVRDGLEVARSIADVAGHGVYQIGGLRNYNQWWGRENSKWHALVRDAEQVGLPSEELLKLNTDVQKGAVEWMINYIEINRHKEEIESRIWEVRYDALVVSPQETIASVWAYLGLAFDDELLNKASRAVVMPPARPPIDLFLPPSLGARFNELQEVLGFPGRAK